MGYSTIAQLRAKLKILTTALIDDAKVTVCIAEADQEIQTDLGGVIDFSLVPTDSTASNFPTFINSLSKYKTCELALVYTYSAKRETTQVDDVTYWRDKYDALVQRIRDGEIALELSDGTSIAGANGSVQSFTASRDTKPYFGTGDYGTYQDDDDKDDDEERG